MTTILSVVRIQKSTEVRIMSHHCPLLRSNLKELYRINALGVNKSKALRLRKYIQDELYKFMDNSTDWLEKNSIPETKVTCPSQKPKQKKIQKPRYCNCQSSCYN